MIRGVGDRRAVLDGQGQGRVLMVPSGAVVTLRGLVVTRGDARDRMGGGVWNRGTVTLIDSVVRDNRARWAGGISSIGTMTLVDSAVMGTTRAAASSRQVPPAA